MRRTGIHGAGSARAMSWDEIAGRYRGVGGLMLIDQSVPTFRDFM